VVSGGVVVVVVVVGSGAVVVGAVLFVWLSFMLGSEEINEVGITCGTRHNSNPKDTLGRNFTV
jgi:hypothetical protein